MTGEFKVAKGWRIFIYIISPLLIGLFVYVGFISINNDSSNLTTKIILLPISLGGTILFTYGLIETIKGRFIIEKNSISLISISGTKTLEFQEIKGFRVDSNYIYLNSNVKGKKTIKISTYIEKSDQILEWLSNKFIELDSHEAEQEEQEILTNDEFGLNKQAREYRLNQARTIAKYINIIGGITGAWLLFYPRPYFYSISFGMIVPAIALITLFSYRGLIRFDEKPNSAHPSIIYGFLFPSLGLLIRSIMDFELLEYKSPWIVICTFTFIIAGLLIFVTKEFKFRKIVDYFTVLSLIGFTLTYFYGTYVITNCLFDKSEAEVFRANVIEKEISAGKSTTYYLTLNSWGPRTEKEKVSVAKEKYEMTEIGETVDVYLRQGLLKTPWFYIVTK